MLEISTQIYLNCLDTYKIHDKFSLSFSFVNNNYNLPSYLYYYYLIYFWTSKSQLAHEISNYQNIWSCTLCHGKFLNVSNEKITIKPSYESKSCWFFFQITPINTNGLGVKKVVSKIYLLSPLTTYAVNR